jgi:hypothetical protein
LLRSSTAHPRAFDLPKVRGGGYTM